MAKLTWDNIGDKIFETGIDQGVLYKTDKVTGVYGAGVPWNGLVSVNESPSGAEANKQYANNKVYANITSAEEFSASLEAFTYPDEFAECDGSAEIAPGVFVGQQRRVPFGLAYRTFIGNDTEELDHGYKIHIIYGGKAAPSERSNTTINESPEAMTMSWEISTTPVEVPGFKPAASLVIDSTKVSAADLAALEAIIYGDATNAARLPLPEEVIDIVGTQV